MSSMIRANNNWLRCNNDTNTCTYIHKHIHTLMWMQTEKNYSIKNWRWSDRSTYGWDIFIILKWPKVYICCVCVWARWCAHECVCACLCICTSMSSFDDDDNDDDLRNTEAVLPFAVIVYCVCVYGQQQTTNFLLSRWNR